MSESTNNSDDRVPPTFPYLGSESQAASSVDVARDVKNLATFIAGIAMGFVSPSPSREEISAALDNAKGPMDALEVRLSAALESLVLQNFDDAGDLTQKLAEMMDKRFADLGKVFEAYNAELDRLRNEVAELKEHFG